MPKTDPESALALPPRPIQTRNCGSWANTVTVGIRGTTTAAAASTGTITLGGTAVLNVNAGGLKLADTSVGASTGTTTGILNINGTSTVNMVGGDILGGGGTSTITLNGGTLDLQYHNLDTSGGPIANLNLQTGTLKNVLEINGGGVGLTKTVAGTLIVDGVNAYTGNTNVNAGTLALAAGGSITGSTTITVASGAIANINGTVPTNATVNANGTTNFGGTTANAPLTRTLAALNIAGGVTASITPSTNAFTPTFLSPTSLSFGDGSAKLDLTNNAIIATGDQDVALTLIQSGQVFSSTLADPNHALGYTSVPSSSNMEIRYTFKGDTKLDGKVNVGDLGALATNYNTTGGMSWANGDFNQDHTVNVADLGALATNYNVQLGSGSSSAGGLSAEPLAVVAASALSSAAVPEPSTFALLGLGALGQMSRRPRRHNV